MGHLHRFVDFVMGAEQQARQQLVEALAVGPFARAVYATDHWDGLSAQRQAWLLESAEAALTVVETLRTKCEGCDGSGAEPPGFMPPDGGAPEPHAACGGTGLGPLTIDAMRGWEPMIVTPTGMYDSWMARKARDV